MPKLSDKDIEINRHHIKQAALTCFLREGYHSVSVRKICEEADVSLGNLYNYFEGKKEIYLSIFKTYAGKFFDSQQPLTTYLVENDFPNDMPRLAAAVESIIKSNDTFFKLCMLDAIEFSAQNSSSIFSNLEEKISSFLPNKKRKLKSASLSFAVTAIYLNFYAYFVLKEHYQAKQVFIERSDKKVIEELSQLFITGVGKK